MNTEIKLAVAELKEALPGLSKVVGRGRSLPVLQSVRINRNPEGIVTLHATDLDSFVTYTARGAQQGPSEEVLVPMDQLTKALKCSSPKEDIGIVPEAKDKVKIRYNIAGNLVEQTISTIPVEDYPPAPKVDRPAIPLEPGFGVALRQALECCSEDASRYVLKGACLDVTDKKYHYVVGTNGRMLFSANSFCFTLEKSLIIPDSKFLSWSEFLHEQPASLSVEYGQEPEEAKDGKPAKEAVPGWVKLQSPRWTFITKEIEGKYPNWKQVVPTSTSHWTQVVLEEEAVRQLILVVPNLPGAETPHAPVRLRVDRFLTVEGQNKEDQQWTGIPVQAVKVEGNPVTIALNREYLLRGLRFGLNKLEIQDSTNPMIFSKGGKKMVIMPVRMEDGPVQTNPTSGPTTPAAEASSSPTTQPIPPQPNPEATTKESTQMAKKNKTTEPTPASAPEAKTEEATGNTMAVGKESPSTTSSDNQTSTSVVKSLVEQVEAIKDSLRAVIRDLTTVIDTVKQAEKEKRATEKEIDTIRAKLRQIQSVSI